MLLVNYGFGTVGGSLLAITFGGSGGKFVDGCNEVHRGYYEVEMVVQA